MQMISIHITMRPLVLLKFACLRTKIFIFMLLYLHVHQWICLCCQQYVLSFHIRSLYDVIRDFCACRGETCLPWPRHWCCYKAQKKTAVNRVTDALFKHIWAVLHWYKKVTLMRKWKVFWSALCEKQLSVLPALHPRQLPSAQYSEDKHSGLRDMTFTLNHW